MAAAAPTRTALALVTILGHESEATPAGAGLPVSRIAELSDKKGEKQLSSLKQLVASTLRVHAFLFEELPGPLFRLTARLCAKSVSSHALLPGCGRGFVKGAPRVRPLSC